MMIHRSPEAGALIPNLTRKFSHDGSGNPLVCLGPRRTASCPCSPTTRARAPGSWLPGLFACICIHLCETRMHRHTRRITRSRRSVSTPVQNTQGPRHTAPTPQGPLCAGGGGGSGMQGLRSNWHADYARRSRARTHGEGQRGRVGDRRLAPELYKSLPVLSPSERGERGRDGGRRKQDGAGGTQVVLARRLRPPRRCRRACRRRCA